ncbi:FHA domain-containing protein [Actinomadura madurae]|uniref:FHA domain-containing protein n=1 Tax=Actinomadura madurae TaxID=1993 RepID=UPI00202737F8|nr:FHA domain-containing protein [Actinomadura madurae]MCP9951615.1 FHA domain-containing protein [Actinomadura madurae]MCP9968391.1 FHA domain-containing protein [Actinomadura madurae]MCP9980858.1 FHA domain-containing protein [Actinomadura madurae]MCQ0007644.1 FHA domain-containing protein [Actinomadura madurae]URM97321.1 FHA domain-containing protein [Actinomadura madurae]
MPVCPSGHSSQATDYCDVCGDLMEGAQRAEFAEPEPVPKPPEPSAPSRPSASSKPEPADCPHCGTPRSGRFCEVDGYDFETGTVYTVQLSAAGTAHAVPLVPRQRTPGPPSAPTPAPSAPAGPCAVIAADRAYFDTVVAEMGPDAGGLTFPPYCPERRVPLLGDQIRIGRRSTSRALLPEIDLSTPPEDPGVSHLHAVLLAQPDGTWNLIDPGSTNGTTVNGGTEPIPVNVPMPVGDGDRIHVGAWTTITLSLQEGTP